MLHEGEKRYPTYSGWWWYRNAFDDYFAEYVMEVNGDLFSVDWRPVNHEEFYEWLGPVSLEPLPWPNDPT